MSSPPVPPPPVAPNTKVKGSGAYGLVVGPALPNTLPDGSWQQFPENVSKIFFAKDYLNKSVQNYQRIESIMGPNKGFRASIYRHPYKFENLPASTQASLRIKKPAYAPKSPIHLYRMPDLGVNIHQLKTNIGEKTKRDVRKIPILKIFEQILKCLEQVENLGKNGYIHGDIRGTNVLVNSTGDISIIDFDWLLPKEEFVSKYFDFFGFYSNPPEFVYFKDSLGRDYIRKNPDDIIDEIELKPEIERTLNNYIDKFISDFHYIEAMNIPNITDFLHESARDGFTSILEEAKNEKIKTKEYTLKKAWYDLALPTFDSFGLANTLLSMFNLVYPYSIQSVAFGAGDVEKETFRRALEGRITNKGVRYSAEEITAIHEALMELMEDVLFPLSSPTLENRMEIGAGVRIARRIYEKLGTAMGKEVSDELRRLAVLKGNLSVLEPNSAPAGGAGAPPAGGAGAASSYGGSSSHRKIKAQKTRRIRAARKTKGRGKSRRRRRQRA